MVYIIATLLRKAFEQKRSGWKELMLLPDDYNDSALMHPLTRQLIDKIEFRHGGPEYDAKYPDGIPTTLEIDHAELGPQSSGLIMYPLGHARNASKELDDALEFKFESLAGVAVDSPVTLRQRFMQLDQKSSSDLASVFDFPIRNLSN
jgi:2-methylcitrate dehydratase